MSVNVFNKKVDIVFELEEKIVTSEGKRKRASEYIEDNKKR